jgi:hypothetical protein
MANVIIAPHGNEWAVHTGDSADVELFHTQHEALAYAEERATLLHSYILLQNDAGELEQYSSHVPDGVPDEESMDDTYMPKQKRKSKKPV